jgi:hypothetical protein
MPNGERRIGNDDRITPADRMHLGSLTKAITAAVIGALAEQHRMTLETTNRTSRRRIAIAAGLRVAFSNCTYAV